MRNEAFLSEVYADCIMIFDGAGNPKTGEAANFAKKLQKNGAYSATPAVTVTEVDSSNFPGLYRVTFTPDAVGDFDVRVSHSSYAVEGFLIQVQVRRHLCRALFGIVQNSAATAYTILVGLLLRGYNDTITAATITVYDDTGASIYTSTSSTVVNGFIKFSPTVSQLVLSAGRIYQVRLALTASSGAVYTADEYLRV